MNSEVERADGSNAALLKSEVPLIELADIRKSYNLGLPNAAEVLHGVSFAIDRAEFVALIGPSGSGKSTLLNIIGLLERATAGSYRIQGEETSALDDAGLTLRRRAALGFVFQFHHLLPAFTQATGIGVRVVAVGTGQALKLGERGDADVVLVHDREAELRFVAQGWGVGRREVMYNDFVLIGPVLDPAGVRGSPDIAAAFRAMGGQATGEACIQYLCMTEDDLIRLGGRGKCNPPFRTAAEVERVWERLLADQVAYVSTDHAPWPADRKASADIFACGAGLTGLQSFAPLMFTLLDERGLPPTLMATYCAERSARLHGLFPRKGGIHLGADCDLVVLERGRFRFDEADIQDRPEMRWSPYHGREMRARVAATVLRGQTIWDGATVLAQPGTGRFIQRAAH